MKGEGKGVKKINGKSKQFHNKVEEILNREN